MLRLKTFGGLSLQSDAGELAGAAMQKRRLALLAALAIGGPKGLTRDKILGLLWPEVDEPRGRQALSQALYALRKDTGEEDLVLGSDILRLNSAVITTDVGDLEAAITAGRPTDAVALYEGPFLDAIYISGADDFERWAESERVRLAHVVERALEKLATDADAAGDHRAAADWWRKLVSLDPLKTRANVGLMSALASSGERTNALRHVDLYSRRLREELDAEPGQQVRDLAERLRGEARASGDDHDHEHKHDTHDLSFTERFVIERELGRGGMAVVFLARDRRHDRHVALKMLHPELGAAVGRERLAREILVTARLQHPHILPLHDSGDHEGTLYYVMPYVEGESLRGRLTREKLLPLDEAIRIAREVADALEHAHRRGVVHRDIKPENILLAEGHAIVADFGIARLVSAAIGNTGDALTQTGMSLGTPAYMSPEQLSGDADVGPRSDVFSLGCVLFEMLTGRPPWIGANMQALLARRFTEAAPALRSLRPEIPTWLDELVQHMLVDDASARTPTSGDVVRMLSESRSRAPSRLPAMPGELVGRTREIAAASSLLTSGEVRLLTFTGAGGTGKTRLALKVASAVEPKFDGVYFVDLSAVTSAEAVVASIADAMHVRAVEGTDLLTAVAGEIGGHHVLLVLDNFEQVVRAAAHVARLLTACPALRIVVTSRIRLDVRGEHEFFVAPLAVLSEHSDIDALQASPAVQLFIERAHEARPDLVLDNDALGAIASICARLDGLPLAIELAAARCRVMSPRTILSRLEKGFELLSGGARDMPERHQTMRQAITWSYGLLSAPQQDLFARLSVFAGGCTLAGAEAVCDDGTLGIDALQGVEALLDASLLMRDEVEGGEPRLRMLETVREFALERLRDAPGALADRTFARHRAWALALVLAQAQELTGPRQRDALATLAAEHSNLQAAFDRTVAAGDAQSALAFAAAIWRYWLVRRNLREGRDLIGRALALSSAPELDALRADAMIGAGQLAQNNGDVRQARVFFEQVLEIRRRLGDQHGEARSLADLGWVAWRQCEYARSRQLSNESLALAQSIGDDPIAALALGNLGFVDYCQGNLDVSRSAFERSMSIRERLADRRGVAFMQSGIAWAYCRENKLAEARRLLDAALLVHRELRDDRLEAFALDVLIDVELRAGDAARARPLVEHTLANTRRVGDPWSTAHALALKSRAALLESRLDLASAAATESLELRRRIDDRFGEAEILFIQADIARLEKRFDDANELLESSRVMSTELGDRIGVAQCEAALSRLGSAQVLG